MICIVQEEEETSYQAFFPDLFAVFEDVASLEDVKCANFYEALRRT